MNKWLPIGFGVLLVLVGAFWAAQGAGMAGSGSFMDSNPTYISVGAYVAVAGLVIVVLSAVLSRPRKT